MVNFISGINKNVTIWIGDLNGTYGTPKNSLSTTASIAVRMKNTNDQLVIQVLPEVRAFTNKTLKNKGQDKIEEEIVKLIKLPFLICTGQHKPK